MRDLTIILGKDVFVGLMPSLPVCFRLLEARRRAAGFTTSDDEAMREAAREAAASGEDVVPVEPSSEGNLEDLTAITWAAVGVAWHGYKLDCPSYRACDRDAVEYGEQVFGAFAKEHREHLTDAGAKVFEAITDHVNEEEAAIEEQVDFSTGQEEAPTSGAAS